VDEGTIEDDTLFAYFSQLDACADCLAPSPGHATSIYEHRGVVAW
jgi:hypothetical protein